MCKKTLLLKRFLKNLSGKLEALQIKFQQSGCDTINLYFQDESRFGLLTILRRMITAKGVKPTAPYLHRFDNLYLFGAFSPINGEHFLLEMPHCNSETFQLFINSFSQQQPSEFKIVILDNGAFHHAASLKIPNNMALLFLPPYSPELNPAEKMWRHFKDRVSMIAYENIEMLQNKISQITQQLNPQIIKSICSTQYYNSSFKTVFNV
jgi:transposase